MEPLCDADGCAVAAFAVAEGTRDEVARLRAEPGPPLAVPPPPGSLLRHADDHTVLALAAVLRAAAAFPQIGASFADWGVIAAPRWQGRRRPRRVAYGDPQPLPARRLRQPEPVPAGARP
jgi:hypothetical protein